MPRPELSRDRSMLPRAIRMVLPALAIVVLFSASEVSAQYEGRTYAITDARLVTPGGEVIENGTIVVRGGLIEALGADVSPPADAVLIDGEGMTVYPGFIDAYSQAGLALPGRDEREHAGNIAHQLATEYFDPASEDLAAYRKQGLTSALVARSDGVFGGQAVLMNLMGDGVPSMIVKAPVVQVMGYQGQRDYPGTLMAVVAYQRQTLIDAAYHELLQDPVPPGSQIHGAPTGRPRSGGTHPGGEGRGAGHGDRSDRERLQAPAKAGDRVRPQVLDGRSGRGVSCARPHQGSGRSRTRLPGLPQHQSGHRIPVRPGIQKPYRRRKRRPSTPGTRRRCIPTRQLCSGRGSRWPWPPGECPTWVTS